MESIIPKTHGWYWYEENGHCAQLVHVFYENDDAENVLLARFDGEPLWAHRVDIMRGKWSQKLDMKFDVEELMRMKFRATRGPWKAEFEEMKNSPENCFWTSFSIKNDDGMVIANNCATEDAEFIVSSYNAISELVAQIIRLENENEELSKIITESRNAH